jgi:site-specific DNA-cytosine methylase
MSKLKLLSLFSGIGAFEKALSNLHVDYELVGFSEIDKYAIESYCAIHNVDKKSISLRFVYLYFLSAATFSNKTINIYIIIDVLITTIFTFRILTY